MGKLKRKPDGLGESKTYLGKVSIPPPARVGTVGPTDGIDKKGVIGKLNIFELKFLEAYVRKGTAVQAMLDLFPRLKYGAAHVKAGRWMKKIDSKITPEEKFALMGVTTGKLARVVSDAMDAKFQKEFVTREGVIVSGKEHEDHQVRLEAAKVATKLLGIDRQDSAPAISINVIQYAPPGAAPWPTGGGMNPEVIDVTPDGDEI